MLEMDRLERQLVNLPLLLDPSSYVPDTVDLTEDALAREYWLYCFEEALDGVEFSICNVGNQQCWDSGFQNQVETKVEVVALGIVWTTEVVTLEVFCSCFSWTGGEKSCSKPA